MEPTFPSIEEWSGHNIEDHYAILALTGRGRWQPGHDTLPWLRFHLRAHHLQAHTLQRRFAEAEPLYQQLEKTIVQHRLPQRVADPLFDVQLVSGVTRPSYLRRVEGLEDRTVTRDLARLTELGLLEPHGQTCGRYYVAPGELAVLRDSLRRQRAPLADPLSSLVGRHSPGPPGGADQWLSVDKL